MEKALVSCDTTTEVLVKWSTPNGHIQFFNIKLSFSMVFQLQIKIVEILTLIQHQLSNIEILMSNQHQKFSSIFQHFFKVEST